MNSRKMAMRMPPSTRLKITLLSSAATCRLMAVAASSGTNLYMKMKNPIENIRLAASIQPLSSAFLPSFCNSGSSSATLAENFSARKPSIIAWPSVTSPRTNGQPSHLRFSAARSSGSLWVTTSPLGLRMAMPQACGVRIITPSITAWPPTSVSSPPSRAGKSWMAARNRRIVCQ